MNFIFSPCKGINWRKPRIIKSQCTIKMHTPPEEKKKCPLPLHRKGNVNLGSHPELEVGWCHKSPRDLRANKASLDASS